MLAWKTMAMFTAGELVVCSHQLIGPIREEANTKQTSDATITTNTEDPA
jgi:hypothetical protein